MPVEFNVVKLAWFGYNDLETNYPELAKEWHPWRNGKLTPKDVTVSSSKKCGGI